MEEKKQCGCEITACISEIPQKIHFGRTVAQAYLTFLTDFQSKVETTPKEKLYMFPQDFITNEIARIKKNLLPAIEKNEFTIKVCHTGIIVIQSGNASIPIMKPRDDEEEVYVNTIKTNCVKNEFAQKVLSHLKT